MITVHIAGEPVDRVQRCVACGLVLEDRRDHPAPPAPPPTFWPVAGRVAMYGGGQSAYVIRDGQPLGSNEVMCR